MNTLKDSNHKSSKKPGCIILLSFLLVSLILASPAVGKRPVKGHIDSLSYDPNKVLYGTLNDFIWTANDGEDAVYIRELEVIDSQHFSTIVNLCVPNDNTAETYKVLIRKSATVELGGTGTFDNWVIRAPIKINYRVKLIGERVETLIPVMC